MILVSACLAGIPCNHNSQSTPNEKVISLIKEGLAFPVCPEILGGLTIPRSRARIVEGGGDTLLEKGNRAVLTVDGQDVTRQFLRGADLTLKLLRLLETDTVIFKQGSPSCGCGRIGNGSQAVKGDGITTTLFKKEGIRVLTEEDLSDVALVERLRSTHSKNRKELVLISMCGLGIPCQYRARSFSRKKFIAYLKSQYSLIPLCPELFGGMSTPRPACQLKRDRVIGRDGKDYTEPYQRGASWVLYCARLAGVKMAYMKKGSPSCGTDGVARRLLEEAGIKVHLL